MIGYISYDLQETRLDDDVSFKKQKQIYLFLFLFFCVRRCIIPIDTFHFVSNLSRHGSGQTREVLQLYWRNARLCSRTRDADCDSDANNYFTAYVRLIVHLRATAHCLIARQSTGNVLEAFD